MDPSLDTYFPVSFISRAPKYFSERAPCRIVPVLRGTAKQGRATGRKDKMEASESGRKDTLENILQELFSADVAVQQVVPYAPSTTVRIACARKYMLLGMYTWMAHGKVIPSTAVPRAIAIILYINQVKASSCIHVTRETWNAGGHRFGGAKKEIETLRVSRRQSFGCSLCHCSK